MKQNTKNSKINSMANLLKSGAILTNLSCPACNAPIFRFKNGNLWCEQCQKRIITSKSNVTNKSIEINQIYNEIEISMLKKIYKICKKIERENNIENMQNLTSIVSELLENLFLIKKINL